MKILRISSLASFKLLPAIFRVVIILPSKFKESLMHYPWMNFIFHYYLLSFTFKLPSSFWRKKEGVISVEIIIREMKEGGKKEREISASPSQRVWRKKIRFHWILPGTSLFFPRLTFFFIFPPSKRSFFFFFFTSNRAQIIIISFQPFCLIVTSLKFLKVDIVIGVSITVWRAQIYHLSLQKEVNFARY